MLILSGKQDQRLDRLDPQQAEVRASPPLLDDHEIEDANPLRSRGDGEMGNPSPIDALDYLELLADVRPDKFDRAAVRWHARLELEAAPLTLAESQLLLPQVSYRMVNES
jgi:hypothetical protein